MSQTTDCFGFRYDAQGRPHAIDDFAEEVLRPPSAGFVWLHMRIGSEQGDALLAKMGLDSVVMGALCAPETRPRCTGHLEGNLINLRGVNLNPGAEPEDMVSLRMWVSEHLLITVLLRPLQAVEDVRAGAMRETLALGPADLVARLALRLADRAEPVVAALNERIDALEDADFAGSSMEFRSELADLRRVAIVMRRYMVPQRDALSTFEIEDHVWLTALTQSRLREATERVTRLGEELDAIRDRAQIVREYLSDARADLMNSQMFILSIVSALFLPLGFLTGLLGINVGGMPGVENPNAFWIVCALLCGVIGVQWWIFRRLGLFSK